MRRLPWKGARKSGAVRIGHRMAKPASTSECDEVRWIGDARPRTRLARDLDPPHGVRGRYLLRAVLATVLLPSQTVAGLRFLRVRVQQQRRRARDGAAARHRDPVPPSG